jgi:arylsulfatase A-like enzyme
VTQALQESRVSDRPNILILMCDQLTARVLSCYGGPVATPNIDRIAEDGVVFSDAICPTPFCSPSRMSMITGQYPHTHGIVHNVMRVDYPATDSLLTQEGIHPLDVTTESVLHAAGYQTHHYGKWHLTDDDLPYYPDMYGEHLHYAPEMAAVFDTVRSRTRDTWMDWYGWAAPVEVSERLAGAACRLPDSPYIEFVAKMGRLDLPLERVFDVRVSDRTIGRLQQIGPGPFMLTCSFNYPHDPNVVPDPYYSMFDPDEIELPANHGSCELRYDADWSRQIVTHLGEAVVREFLRIYYASVKLVDDQVGRVLDALDATGRADDTIVVFTADHGDMAGGHGMIWKSTHGFYEDVVRVPLLVRYPGRIRPGSTDVSANLTDLMPTLLDLAGQPVPEGVQGRSMADVLLGSADPSVAPAYAFCERLAYHPEQRRMVQPDTHGNFMVRGRGWKYVVHDNGEEFLYDLANDPGETSNRVRDADALGRKREMRDALSAWLARTRFAGRRPLTGGVDGV